MDKEVLQRLERAAELDRLTPKGPYHHCRANDGMCSCGMIWSDSLDIPVLSIAQVDEEHHGAQLSGAEQQAMRDFIAESRTLLPALAVDARAAMKERDSLHQELVTVRAALAEMERERNQARAELKQATEWRPIETAPKDGTFILGYYSETTYPHEYVTRYAVVQWLPVGDEHGEWFEDTGEVLWPTHWQPLPLPPRSEG